MTGCECLVRNNSNHFLSTWYWVGTKVFFYVFGSTNLQWILYEYTNTNVTNNVVITFPIDDRWPQSYRRTVAMCYKIIVYNVHIIFSLLYGQRTINKINDVRIYNIIRTSCCYYIKQYTHIFINFVWCV